MTKMHFECYDPVETLLKPYCNFLGILVGSGAKNTKTLVTFDSERVGRSSWAQNFAEFHQESIPDTSRVISHDLAPLILEKPEI